MSQAVADLAPRHREPERTAAVTQTVARAKRWLGLDLLRFTAVLLMVQGHTFTTLLDQATKAQGWYPHHAFLHGYTAPMFLFGAGLAFGYTTFRKWDEHARGGPAVKKRYTRYLWLLVLGYGLHLPALALSQLLAIDDPARLARMLQVDVLHHIGVSLALAQVLVFLLKKRRVFVTVIAGLALFCVFSAPWVWGMDVSGLPIWLQGYVNASGGSYFPVVPWAGFTYVGIVIAYLVGIDRSERSVSEKAALPFLVLALVFTLAPIAVDRGFGMLPLPPHNFWKTSPLFFFWRLGNVMFVLAGLCYLERILIWLGWLEDGGPRWLRAILPWIKLAAAETLVIYVVHLLVLHGSVFGPGIKHSGWIEEHAHGIGVATAVSVGLFVAMVLLAKGWAELRKRPPAYHTVRWAMIAAIVLFAVTR